MDGLGIHKHGIGDQYSFYAATQQPGESFTQFGTRLRALAANCNFANPEEELRYRFVMGMLPGPERSWLFSVELSQALTFARAVEFAEGYRYTRGATMQWMTPLKNVCGSAPIKAVGGTTPEAVPNCINRQLAMNYDKGRECIATPTTRCFNHKGQYRNTMKSNSYHDH